MMSRDTILFTLAICLVGVSSQVENFHALTNCVCPEEVVTYECTVCGGVVTVWGGSGFQCSSGEILIEHRNFITTGVCNSGRIVARGIRVENGCYTSQLNVTFDAGLQDSSIVCSVDNGTYSRQVGSDTIQTTTESFRPPQRVDINRVNTSEIAFSWTQAQENCSSISYAILSNNCGSCPNTTNSASASCFNFTVSDEASITLCTFMVEVVVCSRSLAPVVGNSSVPAIVNLTVPTVNNLSSLPHYHVDDGLRRLTVTFSTVTSFVISDGINGNASSYTITYSDSASGQICGLDTFLASNCTGTESICSRVFEISSSLCTLSSDINITVSATTNIGVGPRSKPIKEEYKNNFVRVQVISTNINCTFLNSSIEDRKSCNATIIYGDNCQDQTELPGINEGVRDDVVLIKLTDFLERIMPSRYCSFIVSAAAGTRRLSVEGNNINVISLGDPDNRSSVVAAIVVSVVLVVVLVIIAITLYFIAVIKSRKTYPQFILSTEFTPPMFLVEEESNMIEFAKQKIRNYNPDCGKGYFELTADISPPVYISSKTKVVLINEDKTKICTGSKARKVIGFRDEQTPIEPPDLSRTNWKYAFIQSTSRLQKLPQGTHFMFYGKLDECVKQKSLPSLANQNLPLTVVKEKFYRMYGVAKECDIPKFVREIPDLKYNPGLGYGFYEFTKPELISYDKQVVLMGKDNKLYYGPNARHVIIAEHDYDESKEVNPPNFDSDPNTKWKCAFVQTRSNLRVLQPHTHFLYCTVVSTEITKVTAPFKIFKVDEENEDKRKLIKFAKEKVPYYNPRAGYGYYEFTEPGYVLPERNVIAMKMVNDKEELFTGPGVRQLIGAAEDYDGTYEISPPDLSDGDRDWKCIFIQSKKAYGLKLIPGTRFLYCEYDYYHEIY